MTSINKVNMSLFGIATASMIVSVIFRDTLSVSYIFHTICVFFWGVLVARMLK